MAFTDVKPAQFDVQPRGRRGAGFAGTSSTLLDLTAGLKNFTTQPGMAYRPGARVRLISRSNPADTLEGIVQSYADNRMSIDAVAGETSSGSAADWSLVIAGDPGSGDLSSAQGLADLPDKALARGNLRVLSPPQGRITLHSGIALMKASVAGSPKIFYTSAGGNLAPIPDGAGGLVPREFPELANVLADAAAGNAGPAAVIPNACYDIVLWQTGTGDLALTRSDWHQMSRTVTIATGAPCSVYWPSNRFADGTPFVLSTTGALLVGLTPGVVYFDKRPNPAAAASTFYLSATPGGDAINTAGTQSGVHTGTAGDDEFAVSRAPGGNCEWDYLNGFAINKNAIANGPAAGRGLELGTFRTNEVGTVDFIYGGAASGGLAAVFGLSNLYNAVPHKTVVSDTDASWATTSADQTPLNGSLANRVSALCCVPAAPIEARARVRASAAGSGAWAIAVALNSITVSDVVSIVSLPDATFLAGTGSPSEAPVNYPARQGWFFIQAMQIGDGSNVSTFRGGTSNSDLTVEVSL